MHIFHAEAQHVEKPEISIVPLMLIHSFKFQQCAATTHQYALACARLLSRRERILCPPLDRSTVLLCVAAQMPMAAGTFSIRLFSVRNFGRTTRPLRLRKPGVR